VPHEGQPDVAGAADVERLSRLAGGGGGGTALITGAGEGTAPGTMIGVEQVGHATSIPA